MRGSKDAALGFALRRALNARLREVGEITDLSLDTRGHRAQIRLALRGEPDEVEIGVRRFALDRADGTDWLSLVEVDASREWIRTALRQFAVGRPFRISPNAARLLRLLN